MKKLLFIIFVCSTLFAGESLKQIFAGESLKQTLLGYNNPNGRTGMITMKIPKEMPSNSYYAMLPVTDFVTIEFVRTVYPNPAQWKNRNDFNFYFHIPLNKWLEGVFESY
jgi:hypothetical protein